jgi:hypothetical protein
MRFLFILLIFLFLGAFFIVSNENIKINKNQEFDRFLKFYSSWLSSLLSNAKTITGYAIRSNWLPDINKTNISE